MPLGGVFVSRMSHHGANEHHGNMKEDNDTTLRRLRRGELTGSQQVTDRRALLLLFPLPLASRLVFPIVATPLTKLSSLLTVSLCLTPLVCDPFH